MGCNIQQAIDIIEELKRKPALSKKNAELETVQTRLNGLKERLLEKQGTTQRPKETTKKIGGFQGYVVGFDARGKGTVVGDGKDKAMRKIAHGFIGEIGPNKKSNSSTATSLRSWFRTLSSTELDKAVEAGDISWSSLNRRLIPVPESAVIMLARNSEFVNKPLQQLTKERIFEEFENGSSFVVGDMPGVDTQFIEYLDEIGATYTIYSTAKTENEVFNRRGYDGKEWRDWVKDKTDSKIRSKDTFLTNRDLHSDTVTITTDREAKSTADVKQKLDTVPIEKILEKIPPELIGQFTEKELVSLREAYSSDPQLVEFAIDSFKGCF